MVPARCLLWLLLCVGVIGQDTEDQCFVLLERSASLAPSSGAITFTTDFRGDFDPFQEGEDFTVESVAISLDMTSDDNIWRDVSASLEYTYSLPSMSPTKKTAKLWDALGSSSNCNIGTYNNVTFTSSPGSGPKVAQFDNQYSIYGLACTQTSTHTLYNMEFSPFQPFDTFFQLPADVSNLLNLSTHPPRHTYCSSIERSPPSALFCRVSGL